MLHDIPPHVKRRNRKRSIAISDNTWEEIKLITKGYMSVSQFIRMAVEKEIQNIKERGLL
jgi:predicted CopG family antitoxin